jgi:DNA-binding transcriptional LysR family regulator
VTPIVPPGFPAESLMRMRMLPVANPDHPLHKLGRSVTHDDLRVHRQLVVRESGTVRGTRPSIDAAQRWTVSHMATSIQAARLGYGYAWLPEEKIREELAANELRVLPLREGRERYVELYLVYANRDSAGPGVLRLGEIMQETTKHACTVEEAKAQAKPRKAAKR